MPQKRAIHAALVGLLAGAKTIIPPGRFIVWTPTDRHMSHNGLNWSGAVAQNGGEIRHTLMDPSVPGRIWASVFLSPNITEIKYSDDFGVTWTTTHTYPKSSLTRGRFFYHGGAFYTAGEQSGAPSERYWSLDGFTWTKMTDAPGDASFVKTLAPFIGGEVILLNPSSGTAHRSADRGATWTPVSLPINGSGDAGVLPSGRWSSVGGSGAESPNTAYTDDGTTFTPGTVAASPNGSVIPDLEYVPLLDALVATRGTSGGDFLHSNSDATQWFHKTNGTSDVFTEVASNDVVAVFNGTRFMRVTSLSPFTFQRGAANAFGRGLVWHPTAE